MKNVCVVMSDPSGGEFSACGLNTTLSTNRGQGLDTLIHNLDGMAYRCYADAVWTMLFVSRGCFALTGYQPQDLLLHGRVTWEQITWPADRANARSVIERALVAGERFAVEYRIVTRSGDAKWVLEKGMAVPNETGRWVIEGFVQDMTQARLVQQALEHAEQRYRHIFEHASEGIFQTSQEGCYLAANLALAQMYGYATPQALMEGMSNLEHGLYVDPSRRQEFCQLMALHGKVLNFESEVYRCDGSRIWISENAHVVRDSAGELVCYEGTVQDITERKHYQRQLERQANYDFLTGLPNRNLLADRLEQAISRVQRSGGFLAVVMIDLDSFKFINDTLGHAVGDELLVVVAQRLRHSLRSVDTVARQGGDEFVLVLNGGEHIEATVSLLERILDVVRQPIHLQGRDLQIGASLGVALYQHGHDNAETLLKHADVAMYAAKKRGRNNFQFFSPELNHLAQERLMLESAMRVALEQDEFLVYFQPKVDAQRRMVGVEALARWHSTQLGWIGPDRFIPVAEETGLIVPLSEQIFRKTFAAAATWPEVDGRPIRVSVNVSPQLFSCDDMVQRIDMALQHAGLPAHRVELEITEGVLVDDAERVVELLHQLKRLGVSLSMDDFGTGYSSLSYLRRLPLDVIKIDRSLVTDLEHETDVAMIAGAVVSLGQSLNKMVVAEGVETQAQFDFLSRQGCDAFQGYLFSKPLSLAEFNRWLLLPPAGTPAPMSPAHVPAP